MAENHLPRKPQGEAELAHLVLEELAQRLEQLEVQALGQPADVVVRLDGGGLLAGRTTAGAGRLDHVGIDGALGEPSRVPDLLGLALEGLDEKAADDLALLLRVG